MGLALVHAAKAVTAERWGAAWIYAHVAADNAVRPPDLQHLKRTSS